MRTSNLKHAQAILEVLPTLEVKNYFALARAIGEKERNPSVRATFLKLVAQGKISKDWNVVSEGSERVFVRSKKEAKAGDFIKLFGTQVFQAYAKEDDTIGFRRV
jgi:hypothetical protein